MHLRERPRVAVDFIVERCCAASPNQTFEHHAAFLMSGSRQCGTTHTFANFHDRHRNAQRWSRGQFGLSPVFRSAPSGQDGCRCLTRWLSLNTARYVLSVLKCPSSKTWKRRRLRQLAESGVDIGGKLFTSLQCRQVPAAGLRGADAFTVSPAVACVVVDQQLPAHSHHGARILHVLP